jgi:ketosteroid isomerase-like protein
MNASTESGLHAVLDRLRDASNAHDVAAIAACFASDYRNETPIHPSRGFTGADQVARNWTQILKAIPDLRCEVTARAVDTAASRLWSEWEHRGTRRDGTLHLLRGVVVFTVEDEVISAARFYLEPVDDDGGTVDRAVQRQVVRQP